MRFKEKETEKLLKYVKALLEAGTGPREGIEVLITPDGRDYEVNYNQLNYDIDNDHYVLVDSEALVMHEYEMPDKHFEYFQSYEEYQDFLKDWLEEEKKNGNEWVCNEWHTGWHLKSEEAEWDKFREQYNKEEK